MSISSIPAVSVFQEAAVDAALFQVADSRLLSTDPYLLESSLLPGLDIAGLRNEGVVLLQALRSGRLVTAAEIQKMLIEELARRRPSTFTRFQSSAGMRESLKRYFTGQTPIVLPTPKTEEILAREKILTVQNTQTWRGTSPVYIVQSRADLAQLKENEEWRYVVVELTDGSHEIRIAEEGRHYVLLLKMKDGHLSEKIVSAGLVRIHNGEVQLNGDGDFYQTRHDRVTPLETWKHFSHPIAAKPGLEPAREIFEKMLGPGIPVTTKAGKGFRDGAKPREILERETLLSEKWGAPVIILRQGDKIPDAAQLLYRWVLVNIHEGTQQYYELRVATVLGATGQSKNLLIDSNAERDEIRVAEGEGSFSMAGDRPAFFIRNPRQDSGYFKSVRIFGGRRVQNAIEVLAYLLEPEMTISIADVVVAVPTPEKTGTNRADASSFDMLGIGPLYQAIRLQHRYNFVLVEDAMGIPHFRVEPDIKSPPRIVFEGDITLSAGQVYRDTEAGGGIAFIITNASGGILSYVEQANFAVSFLQEMIPETDRRYIHAMTVEQWNANHLNPNVPQQIKLGTP